MRRKHSLTSTRWGQEAYSSTQQLANRDRKAEKVLPLRLGHRACLKPRDCSRKAVVCWLLISSLLGITEFKGIRGHLRKWAKMQIAG